MDNQLDTSGDNTHAYGGGIYSTGKVEGCEVYGNSVTSLGHITSASGGGIYNFRGEVRTSRVYNNSSVYGGGIANDGALAVNCLVYKKPCQLRRGY